VGVTPRAALRRAVALLLARPEAPLM